MTEAPGTGPDDKLTTDPPLPPGTPDVDELVGDPVPGLTGPDGGRSRPDGEDVADGGVHDAGDDADDDPVTGEPPD